MKVEQIYTGCLAQGAYYIESKGEAVVIDPLREVHPYLETAKASGAKIKYVLETHFHADFVSGHIDLAKQSGATIVFGPNASPKFDTHIVTDGEILKVGDVSIKVLHTPGHTMESVSYLLLDKDERPYAVFTGDTLFLGDVGRPDLAVKSDLTQAELAEKLYDSLRNKLMTLPDDVIVYPGHGAGSACGKNMRKETVGSIGEEKATNYALRADMTKEEFVKEVTTGLAAPPSYFPKNVAMNRDGYESINSVLDRGLQALSPEAFDAAANEAGALILDTRNPNVFVQGFIPNSISIGIDGGFAPWVGTLVPDITQPILIVADKGREEEVVTRLARVGYDNSIGFLKNGFESWKNSGKGVDRIESIQPETMAERMKTTQLNIVDVRKPTEFESEHVEKAANRPLDLINIQMSEYDKDEVAYVYCAGGYRSVIACSILKARGYENLINVECGFPGIKGTGVDCKAYVCPSTLA